jgi:hypothetical protein
VAVPRSSIGLLVVVKDELVVGEVIVTTGATTSCPDSGIRLS